MKRILLYFTSVLILAISSRAQDLPVVETGSKTPMPEAWIDKDTGHKLIHLTAR
nr:oligogalacturonate lyase [Sunxiuqinia sp.]